MSLIIRNLNKKFGRKEIFTDFSYSFDSTGLYVITGGSGRGKTTLLRIIAGLDKDYSGTVNGGGIGAVSFHFQEYRLFESLTVLQNVTELAYANCEMRISEAEDMLIRLGISADDFNRPINELSGGMKMRVAFARAVLKDTPIILLDEALKELDLKSIETVCDIIREKAQSKLVILVTHKMYPELWGPYKELVLK